VYSITVFLKNKKRKKKGYCPSVFKEKEANLPNVI